MPRNYKQEYEKYHKSEKAKKNRAKNNKANRDKGTYGNGDGKDVAHKDNNVKNGAKSNLVLQSPSKNRSFNRDSDARRAKKG